MPRVVGDVPETAPAFPVLPPSLAVAHPANYKPGVVEITMFKASLLACNIPSASTTLTPGSI